jgi:hypothetical protein
LVARTWLGAVSGACALTLVAACAAGGSDITVVDLDGGPLGDASGLHDARSQADARGQVDGGGVLPDAGDVDGAGAVDASGIDSGIIVLPPHQAYALVGGGVTCQSPNFVMTHSLSQAPGGNGTEGSRSYLLFGGLVGATQ